MAAYFYASNGLVASNQPEILQRAFDVLTGIFDQVRLRTNTQKTVIMSFQQCHTPVKMSVEAYEMRAMGKGPNS